MLAASDSGWWQTTWPIISAPIFLIVGILGTIITSAFIERSRAGNAKATRTHEWQRSNLIELQEVMYDHYSRATHLLYAYNDAVDAREFEKYDEYPVPADLRSNEERDEFNALCFRLRFLMARSINEKVRTSSEAYMTSVYVAMSVVGAKVAQELDVAMEEYFEANEYVGELLRTEYA